VNVHAAVTRAVRAPLSLEHLELEEPRPDEILVRVVATGVCHTDIAMRDQTFPVPQPIVLGHEGAGVVERTGSAVTKVAPGDHVVMTYNSCGFCPSCAEHQPTYCYDFFGRNFAGARADGSSAFSAAGERVHGNFFGQSSFANYALCHERNVVKVPSDVDLALLGPLACGVQTGAGAVINALRVGVGHSFAAFGAGSVGLSAVMAARVAGATTIVAVDLNDARLELARELGATHTFNGSRENVTEAIVAATGGGVNFALEATGIPAVIRQAVDSLAPRGTCGIVGAAAPGSEVSLDVLNIMTAGRTLRGIVEGESTPEVFIPALIALYRQGRFPFDRLVEFYPFERINDAIHASEAGRVVKAVVRMTHENGKA
jgi:aryl-alcohol dehydrogenase